MTVLAANIQAPAFLKLLADELRWKLLAALARSDFNVQELIERVGARQNLVSYHLQKLKHHDLVRESRSIADGREIYYSLNLDVIQTLLFSVGEQLHPALSPKEPEMTDQNGALKKVLFLCTHNSARSQMAEGLLRAKAGDKVEVFSAGTEPSKVNPFAIQAMDQMNIDIRAHTSKDVSDFLNEDIDYVITVCDRAKESCPIFPGTPEQIHWSFPDPAEVEGGDEEKARAFYDTALQLSQRINHFMMVLGR